MNLASSTLPANTGSLELTGVTSDSISLALAITDAVSTTGVLTYSSIRPTLVDATVLRFTPSIAVANSISTTGVLTYSNIRPILTGVVSLSMAPASSSAAPATRQILIT